MLVFQITMFVLKYLRVLMYMLSSRHAMISRVTFSATPAHQLYSKTKPSVIVQLSCVLDDTRVLDFKCSHVHAE